MTTNKLTRELETRSMAERPKQWSPPDLLPEPDKEPSFSYRWIRVSTLNTADPRNITGKLREGWEPVKMIEQPKFRLLADPNSRFQENIEIGGLMLCKCPDDFMVQRDKYYHDQTKAQTDAVDNNLMSQSDSRMPLFRENKSSTSFGKGF